MPIHPLPPALRTEVQALFLALPGISQADSREAYLRAPLPEVTNLPGITSMAAADVLHIGAHLDAIGTISGGRWPFLVLLDFLLMVLPEGSAIKQRAVEVRRRVEAFYADSTSPQPSEAPVKLEAVLQGDDRLPFTFIERAMRAASAVGLLAVTSASGNPLSGTCWLLTPKHVITNWHVVACLQKGLPVSALVQNLGSTVLKFDYTSHAAAGVVVNGLTWAAGDEALDYAVLELPVAQMRTPLTVNLAPKLAGVRLNVVQHPQGGPLSFAIRENDCMGCPSPDLVRYLSDTEPGSSGSPVCDDAWTVVALHHAARQVDVALGPKSYSVHNEGVIMKSIVARLPEVVSRDITTVG